MKTLVVISILLAVSSAQYFPGVPRPGFGRFPPEDQYAASLGGAPVGVYDKKHLSGTGPFGGSISDVSSASLGGAKVGIYGKEHPGQPAPGFIPFAAPVVRPYPLPIRRPYPLPIRPVRPVYPPPRIVRRPPIPPIF